jgi:phosphoribosylanthranilate isomerase
MRTRIKICGFTNADDAVMAGELGVDAIGLNFVGGPRKITYETAWSILSAIPMVDVREPMPHFERAAVPVALCHAPSRETYGEMWPTQVPRIKRFQLYGEDAMKLSRELIAQDPLVQVWPVVHLSGRQDVSQLMEDVCNTAKLHNADAIVLDTASKDKLGGTGQTFDWNWLEELQDNDEMPPIILAGGLTPENVAEAIRVARPYAVDVASGVEVAGKPGVKDVVKMRDFVQAVRGADAG